MRRRAHLLFSVLLLLGVGRRAGASTYDAQLDSILRTRSPSAESLFIQANQARESGNGYLAIDLYGRVLALVPDFGPASRRRAMVRLRIGQRKQVLDVLHDLVSHDSSAYNLGALAEALVETPPGIRSLPGELDEARIAALRAVELAPEDVQVWQALLAVGFQRGDHDQVRRALEALLRLAPREWNTWAAVAVNEMAERRPTSAAAALERARALGMPQSEADRLSEWLDASRGGLQRAALMTFGGWFFAIWLAVFTGLMAVGLAISRITLAAAGRALSDAAGRAVGLDAWLRRTYGTVLWLCCAYYYVSIPLVLVLVLGLGGGLTYLLLRVGHIPVNLLLLVVGLTFVTAAAVVRSLVVRGGREDPGDHLDLSNRRGLRDLLDRVAARIGTRAVDDVYLTPGTDVAVLERGGLLRQMKGNAQRCLILGIGVLDGMTIGQLKAILAHEYGHFSNRDTAGGGFALSVRRSLFTMAARLAHGGAAGWFNPAWLFVRGYYAIFMRISQGASRLQEVLADRWAAFAFGSGQFAAGLTHVIESSVAFEFHVKATLDEALAEERPLPNLYSYRPSAAPPSVAVSDAIREAMTAEPSPFDSHPSPSQRLAWVRALGAADEGAASEDDQAAWSLFPDREELERRMTARVRSNVEAAHGVRFAS